MPSFRYVALAEDGRRLQGIVQAPDAAGAARRLQQGGWLPVEVTEQLPGAAMPRRGAARRPTRPRELARLTRGLALLTSAGLPLERACGALATAEEDRPMRRLLESLRDDLRGGRSLADALRSRPGNVPGWCAEAVAASDGTGRLPQVLDRIAAELLRQAQLAERLRAGLLYPAFVLALALLAVAVLVGVVLPSLEPLLQGAAGEVPATTRAVLAAGAWLRDWGALGAAGLLGLGLLAHRATATEARRAARDAWLLRLPAVGNLLRASATARAARVLAMLLGAGVPLNEALGQAAAAAGNAAVGAALQRARDAVAAGARLGAALAEEPVLPRIAVTLAGIGEEGSRVKDMLEETANILDDEAERASGRLMAVLVPGVTLLLGTVVGGIVLATLEAILGANGAALAGR